LPVHIYISETRILDLYPYARQQASPNFSYGSPAGKIPSQGLYEEVDNIAVLKCISVDDKKKKNRKKTKKHVNTLPTLASILNNSLNNSQS